ncbi:Gp138 family membrane-puncturing spike protein [Paenibacillus antarcticus]|uniref:Phage protein Gp138 N-terminal domain-containing protein n=1 Tax=Paenibacillus antarcticus TaxID=253703 RepID=A0A168QVK7_9BACL|nr:Gp138 family membrane-puncturing spike protein [Paenibacillus antarcticus]OAB48268.1 hypothetical protein PBAT_01100 [Paenibacillus antarcticus]
MKNDPASTLSQVIAQMMVHQLNAVHVGFPCRVISFDEATCKADVQPLVRTSEGDPAMIQGVPALGHRFKVNEVEQVYRPSFKSGDTVYVVCADREIKNALNGQVATADTERRHDVNDAVIVGVFACSL